MNFLKGLAITLLSLLLFLSLSVFGIVFTLNSTILNPDFVVSEVNKIDMSAVVMEIAGEQLTEKITEQLPPEVQGMEEAISNVINSVISSTLESMESLIKEQLSTAIYSSYDFLLGKSDNLKIIISLEQFKEALGASLRESLYQTLKESLPPQLAGLPAAQIESYFEQFFNEFYQGFAAQIPSEFEIDESLLPSEALTHFNQARKIIGYIQTGYYALVGFMILLILGIILIKRQVRNSTRDLGITFLLYGAFEFAGVLLAKNLVPTKLPLHELPSSLQPWLLGLFNDLLTPLETLSIGLMAAGAVLLIISFLYKPRTVAD